jgi:O-methyltransferase involved in polyketide biosynthesis
MDQNVKDYSSISPSAQSLLWMKALTDIPFAREAAMLVFGEEALPVESDERVTSHFLKRLLHFDARYWSIDTALGMIGLTNILEVSSGFSFRGLRRVLYEDVFYIDTDLPDVITVKETLLKPLLRTLEEHPVGQLLLRPLNVMDEEAFLQLANRFPPGPLALVNEGLLVYLAEAEKRKLCATIYTLLKKRGGYWITADIYVRNREESNSLSLGVAPTISKFLADHHVEENKFESFSSAESFFGSCGLRIAHKAVPDYSTLRSMELLKDRSSRLPNTPPIVTRQRIRETWILEAIR